MVSILKYRASITLLLAAALLMVPSGCVSGTPITTTSTTAPIVKYTYRVVNTYPHDPTAFTQGLVYADGFFYESTGLYGKSSLRKVEMATGRILQLKEISPQYFAEGLALWQDSLIQLTWQSQVGFVYDKTTFDLKRDFSYLTEGWGLTYDGRRLIMSDGTSTIYFLDPETFHKTGQIEVRDEGTPVVRLNELEYIEGKIYANVWQTNKIVVIDPSDGRVTGWIDLGGLLPAAQSPGADVLNGIAYDAAGNRLFVTGKLWPLVFEVVLIPLH